MRLLAGLPFSAAVRNPTINAETFRGTFEPGGGDLVGECMAHGCSWIAMGPRPEVGAAFQDHVRLHHGGRAGGLRLNYPRQ